MPRDESLDDILARLDIKVTSFKPNSSFVGGNATSTPRPLTADRSTTPSRTNHSCLTTPYCNNAGVRIATKPSPSLLDQYMGASPAGEIRTALLGSINEIYSSPGRYFSKESKTNKEPLFGNSRQVDSTAFFTNSNHSSDGSSTPYRQGSATNKLLLATKYRSFQEQARDFSIPSAPAAAPPVSDDNVSVSVSLSTLEFEGEGQPPSRLKNEGSRLERVFGAMVTPSSFQSGLQTPGQATLSRNNSEWKEPQRKSFVDDFQTLMLPREVSLTGATSGKCNDVAAAGSSMECSILKSRVSELQAQLRLKEFENEKSGSQALEAQQERDAWQEEAQRWKSQAEAIERQLKQAEAQRLGQQQEAEQLRAELQSREARDAEDAAAIGQLQAELDAERGNSEALQDKVQQLEALVEQELHQLRVAEQFAGRAAIGGMQALRKSVGELSAENERLQKQLSKLQVERLTLKKQGEAAGERLQEAEARCRQLELDMHAAQRQGLVKEGELEDSQRQVSSLEQQIANLKEQLTTALEQCQQSQRALLEEQQGSQQQRLHASVSQESETALTAQVKGMAAQILHLQQESARLKLERSELQKRLVTANSAMQDELACAERQAAALQVENGKLQEHVRQAGSELQGKVQQMEEQRATLKQVQGRNASLQDRVQQYEEEVQQYGHQVGLLREESAALQEELRGAKGRVAELEAAVARSSRGTGAGLPGASPLRDVVGSIREELQEKDLQLVQLSQDLAAERRRAQEVQRQMLDQAMELDELQRQQSEVSTLRQQLAAAHGVEAQLKKRVGELSQQLDRQQGDAGGGTTPRTTTPREACAPGPFTRQSSRIGEHGQEGGGGAREEAAALRQELARLQQERDQLQAECEKRDAEVMHLQGQVRILQSQTTDAENWLMSV